MKKGSKAQILILSAIAGLTLCGAQAQAEEPTPIENLNIERDSAITGAIKNIDQNETYDLGNITINNNTLKSNNNRIMGGLYLVYSKTVGTITNVTGNTLEAPVGQVYGGLINATASNNAYVDVKGVIKDNVIKSFSYDDSGNKTGSYGNFIYGGLFTNLNSPNSDITEVSGNKAEAHGNGNVDGTIARFSNFGTVKNIQNNSAIGTYVYGGMFDQGSIKYLGGAIKDNTAIALNYDENGNPNGGGNVTGGVLNYVAVNDGNVTEVSGNYAEAWYDVYGGAIYNPDSATYAINGDVKNNHAISHVSSSYGGTIYGGTITELNGQIKNNSLKALNYDSEGNVIGGGSAYGGAIYYTKILGGTVTGISDNLLEGWDYANGGAIYGNYYSTFKMNGDITNNRAVSYKSASASAQGGAIWQGTLSELNGAIKNNSAVSLSYDENGNVNGGGYVYGGAMYTVNVLGGEISEISGNYGEGWEYAYGGAFYNSKFNADISGDITDNHARSYTADAQGGVFYSGTVDLINGSIKNNYAEAVKYDINGTPIGGKAARGGVFSYTDVYNMNSPEISGNYVKGWTEAQGGVSYSEYMQGVGNLINNHATAYNGNAQGGALHSTTIATNLVDKYSKLIYKYVVTNSDTGETLTYYNKSTLDDIQNALNQGKKLVLFDNTTTQTVPTTGQYSWSNSWTKIQENIANGTYVTEDPRITLNITDDDMWKIEGGITNVNIIGNYAEAHGEDVVAQGGAIYQTSDLNIIADGSLDRNDGEVLIKGNYVQVNNGEKDYQAIYMNGDSLTLNMEQKNGGRFYLHDNINGVEGYKVNIKGDGTGTMYLFNDIHNANVTFDNTTINTVNNVIHTYEFNSLALNSNTNFVADVDLQNEVMDHIETGNNYTIVDGAKLTVSGMNLLNDAKKDNTKIFFAESKLAQSVDTTVKQVAYSPIYKYDVNYIVDENDNQGYFTFARHATPKPGPEPTPGPSPDSFNPAVLSSPVVAQAGAQSAMNQALYYSFEHGDTFMNNYADERFAMINNNAYALSTDYNENGERINYNSVNKGVWVKPYAVFENIPLKNGPKVNTISYGSIIGFDSNFHKLKKGWTNVGTAYIGYNGSQIKYDGVDTTTNGGMLGVTETFYKGNFWTAITATAGAGVAEAHTMYGKDDMTSLMAGIGSKTGYNFEFANGKFIIQPRLFLAYSMIKTFDYTNSAGVRINSDPLHTIQINPAIKFIGNIKDWQPYASVGMNWNVMNQTKVSANGVRLPEMYTRPYVEYGVGLQKHWNDKYSAYGQAMVRNGGRNGIALSLGFRVTLGKEGKPIEKVQNNQTKKLGTLSDTTRTTLKQLTPTQKAKLTNSTRTSMIGIIN